MANISEKKLEMKVVILGCSCSGKTSIIRRYIENTFDDNSPATHGASYSQKKINIKDKSINYSYYFFLLYTFFINIF